MSEPSARASLFEVELEDVHLEFDGKTVLDEISLFAWPRDRLVILGRSGSGKSTLLRVLLGILQPSRGSVKIQGQEIVGMESGELNQIRRKIGMVYQSAALISSLTVAENLALPLEELGEKSGAEQQEIIQEKLSLVGMEGSETKMPSELSGGMKKRVGLARALVLEPELIFYDEPSAGLDPVISVVIDELIVSLSERMGVTSLIVTHELGSAFRVATRMAMLHEGEILLEDTPAAFLGSDLPVISEFLRGFPGGPPAAALEHAQDHRPAL